jgi:hypothetical protein
VAMTALTQDAGWPHRRNLLVMLIFAFITFGLYFPIWFLRRLKALNRLNAPRKLHRWPFVLSIAILIIGLCVDLPAAVNPDVPRGETVVAVVKISGFAISVLLVFQSFFVKDILEDHLNSHHVAMPGTIDYEAVTLSPMLTLFLGIFYLQHIINRHIAAEQSVAA